MFVDLPFALVLRRPLTAFVARVPWFCAKPYTAGGYGLPVDWWMLGTLLYEMLFARTPFEHQDMHVLWSKIQMDKLEFPDDHTASPEAESILTQLLAKRPQDRLGAGTTSITGVQQVKGHAWFRHMDWEAMLRKEIAPPYIPTCDDPLAHFPKHLVDEVRLPLTTTKHTVRCAVLRCATH